MIRLLAVTAMGMIDVAAAFALGGVLGGLVVAIAAGWACAQYDTNYQRARAARKDIDWSTFATTEHWAARYPLRYAYPPVKISSDSPYPLRAQIRHDRLEK